MDAPNFTYNCLEACVNPYKLFFNLQISVSFLCLQILLVEPYKSLPPSHHKKRLSSRLLLKLKVHASYLTQSNSNKTHFQPEKNPIQANPLILFETFRNHMSFILQQLFTISFQLEHPHILKLLGRWEAQPTYTSYSFKIIHFTLPSLFRNCLNS